MRERQQHGGGLQGCDEEVAIVVVREEMRMDVEMMTGVKMAVNEGEEVSIDETMETVMGLVSLVVGRGLVSGGVLVAKVRCEDDWMLTWENRRWCGALMGDSENKTSVEVEVATRTSVGGGGVLYWDCEVCFDVLGPYCSGWFKR